MTRVVFKPPAQSFLTAEQNKVKKRHQDVLDVWKQNAAMLPQSRQSSIASANNSIVHSNVDDYGFALGDHSPMPQSRRNSGLDAKCSPNQMIFDEGGVTQAVKALKKDGESTNRLMISSPEQKNKIQRLLQN